MPTDRKSVRGTKPSSHRGSMRSSRSERAEPARSCGSVRSLRDAFGLRQKQMARLLGVSERTLSQLETEARQPRPETKRRLNEVGRLYDALAEIVDVGDLPGWMETPNDAFDGSTPIQVVERGEIDRLWQMVFAVRTGHPE